MNISSNKYKICSKCNKNKILCNFVKGRNKCRDCTREYHRNWERVNREHVNKRKKQWREDNPEKCLESIRRWEASNPEKVNERKKQWREDNRESTRKGNRIWSTNNKDKKREYERKRRARKQQVKESYTKEDELYTRELFEHKCANCGSIENLCIDHHMPLSKGYPLTRQNAVLLCTSCNCKKQNKIPDNFYSMYKLNEISNILKT